MTKFERLKRYYERGLWDNKRLLNAVEKEWLSAEEYNDIVSSSGRIHESSESNEEE